MILKHIYKLSSSYFNQFKSYNRRNNSFAFSGCGWLTPFHFGVIKSMKTNGYISDSSVFGVTSGGSLAGLIACLDIDPEEALNLTIQMSLAADLMKDIDNELKNNMRRIIPNNALERCNGRLFVTITQSWPKPVLKPQVVCQYDSIDHLLDVICASCFIPIYSARRISTSITGYPGRYIDGGVRAFMPPVGDIRVSPYPIRPLGVLTRYPHISLPVSVYHIPKLLLLSLIPGKPSTLSKLYQDGITAGDAYVRSDRHK